MKRFLILLTISVGLFGAPVENPSSPKLIEEGFFIPKDSPVNVRVGYEGDFVGDARLKQYGPGSGQVDTYEQQTNSGTCTINFFDRVDLYTVLGTSRTYADWRFTASGITHRAQVETLYDFLWGLGARGILYEYGNCSFGLGGRYENSHYDNLYLTIDGAVKRVAGTYLHWQVWQIDLDFSYKIDMFCPYIGVKYSNVRTKIGNFTTAIANNGSGTNQFENRTPVGVVIGCTLTSGKYFMLNLEGRLVDEEAVTISGDLRF